MSHRIGLFVLAATTIVLCAAQGRMAPAYETMYQAMPGGGEALPGMTRPVLAFLLWIATWWWACLLLAGTLIFGAPRYLSPPVLQSMRAWLGHFQFALMALYIALMFTLFWAIDVGLHYSRPRGSGRPRSPNSSSFVVADPSGSASSFLLDFDDLCSARRLLR